MNRVQTLLLTLVASILLASCGASSSASPTTSTSSLPGTASPDPAALAEPTPSVQFVDATGEVVVVESIERIVPVDGDLAEIVFALGLGDHVVATDISATYPPEAAALPDIGYQRALNPEPIAAVEPTVVLATDLAGPPETLEALRDLGIPVAVIERQHTLKGPAHKIQAVADALGVPARGADLAASVTAEITAATQEAGPNTGPRVAVFYLRGDNAQLILGTDFTINAVLEGIGATTVAAEMGITDTRQITEEALLVAAPEVIIATTTGLESVGGIDGLLDNPAIARTPAGQNRRILTFEDQYLLGGGPRTGQLMTELAAALNDDTAS